MINPRIACGAVLVFCAGCYTYIPIQPEAVSAGTEVRARITAAQAERFREVFPMERRLLEGRFVEGDGSSLMLEVPTARREMARGLEMLHQRLSIPRSEVIEIEEKRLDRKRTGAAAFGTGLVFVYVLINRLSGEPGTDRPPDGPPTDEAVVPIRMFRIRLP
jgi:hypothetical protein